MRCTNEWLARRANREDEWTGRTIRADKPGYIPVELKDPLERFGLDAEEHFFKPRMAGMGRKT